MRERRTVVEYGARLAVVALIAGTAAGCVKRHDDRVTSTAAAPPQSAQGSTGQGHGTGTVRQSDRVRASEYDHGHTTTHHGTAPPSHATAAHHGTTADQHLASRVRHALAANKQTKGVGVEAHHGVVTLSGHVRTAAQKRKAGAIAAKVAGVKHVHNAIHAGH